MTEIEKIAYAKSFIDKLANGINPLDDTPVPDGDLVNNVRISRCFFYVSGLLQKAIEREGRGSKTSRAPFAITREQLECFEYANNPISATALTRKINWLVWEDIESKKMRPLSYRNVTQWLLDIGMIEYREWEEGRMKRFPTAEGEAIGLVVQEWQGNGKSSPVVLFSEPAQRFVVDHIEAVINTDVKKGKMSHPWGLRPDEDEGEQ